MHRILVYLLARESVLRTALEARRTIRESWRMKTSKATTQYADVAELADALVSGSSEAIHVGSSPVVRTRKKHTLVYQDNVCFFQLNPPMAEEIHLRWMKSLRDEIPLTRG